MEKDGGKFFLGCWQVSLEIHPAACICESIKTFPHLPR